MFLGLLSVNYLRAITHVRVLPWFNLLSQVLHNYNLECGEQIVSLQMGPTGSRFGHDFFKFFGHKNFMRFLPQFPAISLFYRQIERLDLDWNGKNAKL